MEALRERFGKYHVLEKIAQGGMAEVYKVKTVGIAGFEKVQALKRILPHSAREGRFIRSFIDEARIAVELAHRNIVQVFDFGKADGELYLAMELIEGKDLRTATAEAAERGVPPSIPVAAYIVSEVASGLDYAHRKTDVYGGALGIVHCDVSPSNVMLSADGYVKILDFGIARATFASALERRRLRGKPRYMAPEQTLGEPPTSAADVFALGIIAWELFTGRPLYRGQDLKAILEAVRRTIPPRVDRLNPQVPDEIARAVEIALSREPAQRGTAADLMTACARTAMAAGAPKLAAWLETLEGSPTVVASLPVVSESLPPARPSGTASLIEPPIERSRAELPRVPTVSLSRALDPGPWAEQGTLSGIAHFAEPVGNEPAGPPPSPPAEPAQRPSFATLADPAFAWDPTHVVERGITHVPDHTSYDDLAADSADVAADPEVREEPIDDELPALGTGVAHVMRRRTVVVAAALAGAPRDELRSITQTLGELAYQRAGVVTHLDDDALVVVFGLEVAGEDDVAVAMGWALDAGALVQAADEKISLRVGARAGVLTGVDAAAASVPEDAIDEAKLLAREAAPERPLFVERTGRIESTLYALREVRLAEGPARRFGHSRVIEVVGARGVADREPVEAPPRRGVFVGRTVQLAELELWLQRAIAANRRIVVLLQGAPGTGKTRLCAELIARRAALGRPLRVITTAASPASKLAPFALVIELYQAVLGLPPSRGRHARRQLGERLLHLMTRAGVPDARARAVASDLDHAMELRDGVAVGAPEVADLRPRISAGLAAFRSAMADRERPLLTIIDDVHQGDSASLEVLRHALAVTSRGPELMVLAARPDGFEPPNVDAVIQIGDLVGGELRALIADRLGEHATPYNIAAVLARGGGNPLFVEELAQAVRDAGDSGADIPASARDVVLARMERLSQGARTLLAYAAVLGGGARVRLLEELVGDGGGELAAQLEELIAGGFLLRAEGELPFARGLMREVVYDSLSAEAQREYHARVGKLLASRFFANREEPPATIAEHLERGGEPAAAAAFWLRAGRLALTASDADAAVACFSRTLLLDRELGAAPPTPTSRARRREALAGREEARRLQGNLHADAGDLDELERLCEGDDTRLADVAIRRAQRLLRLGDHGNAITATLTAQHHAMAVHDDRLQGEALRVRAEVLERLGRFDEALALIEHARELFHRLHALHDEMAAMIGRGRIHLLRAHYEEARDAYRPVLALIAKTGDPWLERIVANHVAVIEMCLGNFTRAMQNAERSLELCRRYGDRGREGDAMSVRGIILLEVGLHDQAAAAFTEALEILSHTASRWSRADCMIYAGVCDVKRGRPTAKLMIDEALGEARRIGARYLEANALIARAGAHLARGELARAIEDAAEGTAVAHAATLVGYEIQGLARHALALARSGHPAEAYLRVQRSLQLLETQQYIEGSEEEVLVACVEVLEVAGHAGLAQQVRERARRGAHHKLAQLVDPAWRAAFAALPEIAALIG